MSWDVIKLGLFILGLILSVYEIIEMLKRKKKVSYRSIVFGVLFQVLTLDKVL
ncbi:MAG: hypothetical protein ACI8YP_002114 [Algoriphagus sp.]|jgi:hypothetical protein|tara:strand:+ start:958 stop:1116 length:159 start_codon:yes stop_codon:yes gene_type:complete